MGGEGRIVEIDESMFSKRKHHRGAKSPCQQWVFGIVERNSPNCVMEPVENRDAETLIPIIKEWVKPGTHINREVVTVHYLTYNLLKDFSTTCTTMRG